MASPPLERTLGRYHLDRLLARGGMAEVYRAHLEGPEDFRHELIIKRILPEYARDPEFRAMFLDEAKLVAQLTHPNIVQIHDFGQAEDSYYMAMELVVGPNLGAVVKAAKDLGRPIPTGVAARIGVGIATGLDYAHALTDADGTSLGIVHRDVSTSNVILTYQGIPKIVDFGIAKAANQSHRTRTGVVKGKLAFMAPEQVTLAPLDGRTDLYALGVVLYGLLTGQAPFEAPSEFEMMKRICAGTLAPLRSLRPDVPDELDAIIAKAMALDPAARYARGRELATDLERFCWHEETETDSYKVAAFIETLEHDYGQKLTEVALPGAVPIDDEAPTGATVRLDDVVSTPTPLPTRPKRRAPLVGAMLGLVGIVGLAIATWPQLGAETTTGTTPPLAAAPTAAPVDTPPPAPSAPSPAASPAVEPTDAAQAVVPTPEPAPEPRAKAEKTKKRRNRKASRRAAPEASAIAPPAAPVEAQAKGRLSLLVKPWGDVYVDGARVGTTPMPPVELTAGSHHVRVVHPDSGRSEERDVVVKPSETRVVKFDLTP